MGPYDGAVRQDVFHISIIVEIGEHVVKDAGVTPASVPFIDTVPLTILGWQQPPLGAGTQHPKGSFDKAPTIGLIANVDTRMFPQERQELLPLVISYCYSRHDHQLSFNGSNVNRP